MFMPVWDVEAAHDTGIAGVVGVGLVVLHNCAPDLPPSP
jgi:hypothetical protein